MKPKPVAKNLSLLNRLLRKLRPYAMTYQIKILRGAQKQLEQLSKADYKAVKARIEILANNPRPYGCEKLKDRDGYRVRQGNFRIIYDIHDKILTVEVLRIGDRKDVYK